MTVSIAYQVENPGRIYRPMYCKACGAIMLHRLDFISGERTEKGVFVWFNRTCTGISAPDHARPKRLPRKPKHCQCSYMADVPLTSWKILVKDSYF